MVLFRRWDFNCWAVNMPFSKVRDQKNQRFLCVKEPPQIILSIRLVGKPGMLFENRVGISENRVDIREAE